MLTPSEFFEKMADIHNSGHDPERNHGNADELMCQLLESLGYEQGITIFKNMEKWYA